jgi:hypothetical protein
MRIKAYTYCAIISVLELLIPPNGEVKVCELIMHFMYRRMMNEVFKDLKRKTSRLEKLPDIEERRCPSCFGSQYTKKCTLGLGHVIFDRVIVSKQCNSWTKHRIRVHGHPHKSVTNTTIDKERNPYQMKRDLLKSFLD